MNITVYLGALKGNDESLEKAVRELGTFIGKSGNTLIYGGSKSGLMGLIAESTLNSGGKAIGVEPQFFIDKEPVPETELESRLLSLFTSDKDKAIILRAEEGVPIEKAVNVLDIANRNQIKVVLAVRPK